MSKKICFLLSLLIFVNAAESACFLGNATGCETGVAAGLTSQIVSQLRSMGISFPTLDSTQATCTGSCQPYLQVTNNKI